MTLFLGMFLGIAFLAFIMYKLFPALFGILGAVVGSAAAASDSDQPKDCPKGWTYSNFAYYPDQFCYRHYDFEVPFDVSSSRVLPA